jgi:hypothetical protein
MERLDRRVPEAQLPSLVEWESRIDGFGPTLHANGHRIATAHNADDTELDRARSALMGWLTEVQSWDEVAAIPEAQRRFAVHMDKQDVLTELRTQRKAERIRVSGACPICRCNEGDRRPPMTPMKKP